MSLLGSEFHEYLVAHGSTPDDIARELIAETHARYPREAAMLIVPEQAAFMTQLTKIVGVRRAVEIGTFTGYSALSIARGLAEGGRLICFDISDEYTGVARRHWARAGVEDRIELRLGPAQDGITELPTAAEIDLAFIDADKTNYPLYWRELVGRMRPNGVILIDNTLRLSRGSVLDQGDSADLRAIDAFNDLVLADDRVEAVLLPIGDGLTLARRR
jgi:caffeoyl-CoA O-methyltransferase